MKMKTSEIRVKSVLSKSGIPGATYCVNPYIGCAHACRYCYATFMKRFTGHLEPWGSFVDVKINAHEVLRNQLERAKQGNVMLSSVTDPYQPAEVKYGITRKCLEVIALYSFPVGILTKSPLVIRDIDIIAALQDAEVGITITSDDDRVRKIFEPGAPSVQARIDALIKIHNAGISTYVFMGPLLPMNPDSLAKQIRPYADSILIDRMNYINKTKWLYRKYGIEQWLDKEYTEKVIARFRKSYDRTIELVG